MVILRKYKLFFLITPDTEILTVKLKCDKYSVVYHPPSGNIPKFMELLENLSSVVNENGYNLYLGET